MPSFFLQPNWNCYSSQASSSDFFQENTKNEIRQIPNYQFQITTHNGTSNSNLFQILNTNIQPHTPKIRYACIVQNTDMLCLEVRSWKKLLVQNAIYDKLPFGHFLNGITFQVVAELKFLSDGKVRSVRVAQQFSSSNTIPGP